MKFFSTLFCIIVLIAALGAMNKNKAQCTCDKTEPYRCDCKDCGCANED